MKQKTIVILGSGPAGMAAAYGILQNKTFNVIILEKEQYVGGGGASFKWKNHILDYGPHAFHKRGGKAESLIKSLFEKDPENLIEGKKNVFVTLKNKFLKYPLEVSEALTKFNIFLSIRIILEFIFTLIIHSLVSFPLDSFEMWGKKKFGPKLYEIGFGHYSKKVWKTDTSQISHKFASEKIQGFDFVNLIKRLFKLGGQVTEPYFQKWLYPSLGSGEIYKRMEKSIERLGGKIILGALEIEINNIYDNEKTIKFLKNNTYHEISADIIISTIHLPNLIKIVKPVAPFFIQYTSQKLKYISQILIYLELDAKGFSKMHWFYLLDPKYKFNRITEQKNLSSSTIEGDKTVLCLELTCHYNDEIWNASDQDLISMAKDELSKLPFDSIPKITDTTVKRKKDVYEIYYKNFDEHVAATLSYINSLNNVYSIARRGLFLQGDQHQSITLGLEFSEIICSDLFSSIYVNQYFTKHIKFLDKNSLTFINNNI